MGKSKIFLLLLFVFIFGIAIRSFFTVSSGLLWVGLVVSIIAIAVGILKQQTTAILGGFLLLSVLAGIFRFDQHEMSRPDLAKFYSKSLVLQGMVVEEPERKDSSQRLKIQVGIVDSAKIKPSFYTLVTTRHYPEYKIGDELELRGILQGSANYGDFDYVSYLAKENVFSTVSFPSIQKIGENKGSKLRLVLSRIKHQFENRVDRALPEPHSAFLKGLLVGERGSLPKELVENFSKTGVTHIVALSGYNITIVGSFLMSVLILLTVPFNVSFWIATACIILFVMLTGASPSVIRAGIMGLLVLVAQKEGRTYKMTNALVFAAALMVFQNPRILRFDAAFQLSFLATTGLIFFAPRIDDYLKKLIYKIRHRLDLIGEGLASTKKDNFYFPYFRRILSETLAAQIMVLPLLIYLFGRVSIISPLTNLLVITVVPYSMASGFITGILGFVWEPLGRVSGWLSWVLLEYKIEVVEFFAKVPLASIHIDKSFAWVTAVVYVFILWKLFIKKTPV